MQNEDFTVMVAFNASVSAADNVHGEMYNAFMEMTEDNPFLKYVSIQMVRGNRITQNDIVESNALADESDAIAGEGFNNNPMPEGMPTL